MADKGPLTHVETVKASSYRTPEGSEAKVFRLFSMPLPKVGSPLSAFIADLEHNQPATALRVAKALLAGLPLEYQTGVWNDQGKVSETKVKSYLLDHIADADIQDALLGGRREEAEAIAREALSTGQGGENVPKAEADESDKVAKGLKKAFIEAYRSKLGL